MGQSIEVQTPELALAAGVIGRVAATCRAAHGDMSAAAGHAGDFGGEPVGEAFRSVCQYGGYNAEALAASIKELGRNTGLAALGYVNTDQGVIPTDILKQVFWTKGTHL